MGQGERRSTSAPGSDVVAVAPTEDAVMAFLELLVDPLLPSRARSAAKEPPTADQEASVAKQVQAVVFLYDYYHRKLNPELEYLDFISFCKLAVVLKPSLLTYMQVMQRDDHSELVDLEKEISLTEKMIKEACELVKGLENLGTTEDAVAGWPISKVAVFLVDNGKENCFLLNGSTTLGVWSVIEKENSLSLSPEGEEKHKVKKKRITKKPQRGGTSVDEAGLEQLAFAAVKDACGHIQSNLKVLETHTVYSLSKEKTVARFYIVQCIESNSDFNYLPIRDVIDSLRGPLVMKKASSWSTTSVVEYFHVLPYADIISNWFERNPDAGQKMDTCDRVVPVSTTEKIHRAEEPSVTIVYKKRNNSQKRCGLEETSGFKLMSNTAKKSCNVLNKGFVATESIANIDDLFIDKINMISSPTTDTVKKEVDGLQSIKEQNGEDVSTEDKAVLSSQYGVDGHVFLHSASSPKSFDKIHAVISSKGNVLSQTASKVLLRKRHMLRLQLRKNQEEIARCQKNIDTISRGGADALAVTLDTLIEGCSDVNVASAVSAKERAYRQLPFEANMTLQTAIEMQCFHDLNVTSAVSAEERAYRQLPFEANLTVENAFQELAEICHKNNWPSPIYHGSTLEGGGCQSHVEVAGKDFKLSVTGAVCATPPEAKDSAASSILIKLRNVMAAT